MRGIPTTTLINYELVMLRIQRLQGTTDGETSLHMPTKPTEITAATVIILYL